MFRIFLWVCHGMWNCEAECCWLGLTSKCNVFDWLNKHSVAWSTLLYPANVTQTCWLWVVCVYVSVLCCLEWRIWVMSSKTGLCWVTIITLLFLTHGWLMRDGYKWMVHVGAHHLGKVRSNSLVWYKFPQWYGQPSVHPIKFQHLKQKYQIMARVR